MSLETYIKQKFIPDALKIKKSPGKYKKLIKFK